MSDFENEEKIKISIIVPIYNTSKFLEKCIRSIMEQSLKDIEIICINDGSEDNSLKILEKLKAEDNRIILINKKNEGVSKARNVAINISRGKYCLNIDSDDWIEQGYFESLYSRAERDDLDITLSNIIFDFKNSKEKNYVLNDLNISEEKVITGKEYIDIFLKNNFHGYTCNKLIKTELYKKNKISYREEISILEDAEVILQLAYFSKKIGKINQAFYHYIQHENNTKINFNEKKVKDINEVFKFLKKFFIGNELIIKRLNILKCEKLILGYKYLKEDSKEFIDLKNELFLDMSQINLRDIPLKFKRSFIYLIILKLSTNSITLLVLIKTDMILKNYTRMFKNKGMK